jgi:hypothetical protein
MPPEIAKSVRKHLAQLDPLSVITLDDLYRAINVGNQAAIRAALYACAIGTPVAARAHPNTYFAIRLNLPLDNSDMHEEVFLSLPAIPRTLIERDASDRDIIEIQKKLSERYSAEVVDYWFKAAQYRSVDLIRKSMNEAKERTHGACTLCQTVNVLRTKRRLPLIPHSSRIQACHVISRRSVFWNVLSKVATGHEIFSPKGVEALTSSLRNNDYHSNSRFMIGLCRFHDKLLLRLLKRHASDWKGTDG